MDAHFPFFPLAGAGLAGAALAGAALVFSSFLGAGFAAAFAGALASSFAAGAGLDTSFDFCSLTFLETAVCLALPSVVLSTLRKPSFFLASLFSFLATFLACLASL